MALSKDQEQFYQTTLEMTRKQINDLNSQIEEELAKVKERLAELQNAKNAAKQIYDGACKMLGVENDLEKEEDVAGASSARPVHGLVPPRARRRSPRTSRRAASPRGSTSSAARCKEIIYRKEVVAEPERLPQVRLPLPHLRPRAPGAAVRRAAGRSSTRTSSAPTP